LPIERREGVVSAESLREPEPPSGFVARASGARYLATALLGAMRKGVTLGCVGAMLGCSVGTALATTAMERDPGRQMVVAREADGTVVIDTSDRSDDIEISRNRNGTIRVTVNGSSRDFAAHDVPQLAVRANGGDDNIRVRPGTNLRGISLRLEGGAGNDTIVGSDAHDVLVGGEGDDRIWGRKGNDLILGGGGNDELHGEEGRDIIIGGAGDDRIDGGPGNDFLQGGTGTNEVVGGAGQNSIVGEPAGDAGRTIIIRGSPEFIAETEAALDMLRSTPTGRAILETIDASGHRVVIVEVLEPNATAAEIDSKPQNLRRNGKRGRGTDATITWNPRFRGEVGGPAWAYTPPALILGHELVHAFNMVTGTMIPNDIPADPESRVPPASEELAVGLRFDHDVNPRTRKIDVATFYRRLGLPAVSENHLRRELGWPIRTRY
jgi:hypothetical protein